VAEFRQNNDPIEPFNRGAYAVHQAIDRNVLAPVARGYRAVVPTPVRLGVRNVLANLRTPVILVNDVLQGEPRRAGDTLGRFVVNSTLGVGGIFDVAGNRLGVRGHAEDFGQTFARWGVGEGPYLFIPVIGPSNPRDLTGFGLGIAADPLVWLGQGRRWTRSRTPAPAPPWSTPAKSCWTRSTRWNAPPSTPMPPSAAPTANADGRRSTTGPAAALRPASGPASASAPVNHPRPRAADAPAPKHQETQTNMAPRRLLLGTVLALAASAGGARAQGADPARATRFIQSTGQELVAALNSNAPLTQRRQQVSAILHRAVDVEGVGRFILGRWWRQASAAEQQEYMRLFDETLIRNLSARFGEYQGVRFSLGRSQQRTEDDVLVNTIIERPNIAPFRSIAGGRRQRAAQGGGRDRGRHVAAADAAERVLRGDPAQQRQCPRCSRPCATDPAIGGPAKGADRRGADAAGRGPRGGSAAPAGPCPAHPMRTRGNRSAIRRCIRDRVDPIRTRHVVVPALTPASHRRARFTEWRSVLFLMPDDNSI
jgi:ABC-type transporter MlaC component